MTRYYRGMLTATLLAGLALPAFAQTPAPTAPAFPAAAPTAPASPVAAPVAPASPVTSPAPAADRASPDTAAPAKAAAQSDAKAAKPAVHRHHHASTKHKAAATDAKTTPPGQK
jgi:hypothetical protein